MLKTAIAALVVLGSLSAAEALPIMAQPAGVAMPIAKAAVVVKKTVVRRRAPVVRRRTVKKVIVR